MTNRSSFSDTEWNQVCETLNMVGLAATFISPGAVSTPREFFALAEVLGKAAQTYAGVELIVDLLATKVTGTEDKSGSEDAVGMVLSNVSAALRLVDPRATPAEAQAYRKLLREVAAATTSASGSGILGSGEKVSDDERAFLAKLDQILG